jgi:prevent-host-death family protein
MKATAKDLRFHSKELLDTVSRGEEIIITYHGKPCAKIVPYQITKAKTSASELFGIWKDNKDVQNIEGYVRSLRKSRY